MTKKYFKNPKLREIALVALMGLAPLLWFKPGYLITGTDVDYPLDPGARFLERLFSWCPQFQAGTDRSINFASLFVVGLQALLRKSGLGLIATEKISYVFWFLLTGMAMYFLMRRIAGGNSWWQRIARLTGVTAYLFNFYQFFIWSRLQMNVTALVLFPVSLGLLIGCGGRRSRWPAAVLATAAMSVICCSMGIQPPLIGTWLIFIFLYPASGFLFSRDASVRKGLIRESSLALILLIVFFLVGSFWLIPEVNFVFQSGYHSAGVGAEVYKVDDLAGWSSKYTSFLNLFRNLGDVAWFDEWGSALYYPVFQQYQKNFFFVFAGTFLVILPFISLFLFRGNRLVLYFALISLIGIFLGKGLHPPFGGIYYWMLKHVPGFWIYRAPWEKFAVLQTLGFSVLIGLSAGKAFEFLRSSAGIAPRLRKPLAIFSAGGIFLLLIGYHYPVIRGRMFPGSMDRESGFHQKFKLGYHIKFPGYVFDAAGWLNEDQTRFNILLLPDDRTNVYEWGYGASGDVSLLLFQKGIFFRQYGEGMAPPTPVDGIYGQLIEAIYAGNTGEIGNILRLLNVRFILQRNDFRYDFYGDHDSPEFIRERLSRIKEISFDRSFGEWDFYRVKDDYCLPHIYHSAGLTAACGDTCALTPLLEAPASREPRITFKRINPAKYLVGVAGAKSPFWLVFSENFHRQWRLYRAESGKGGFQRPAAEYPRAGTTEEYPEMRFVPADVEFLSKRPLTFEHEQVNGFANGWYVEPEKAGLGEDFTLVIYFWPQSLFYLGLMISGITFVVCAGYWVIEKCGKKFRSP